MKLEYFEPCTVRQNSVTYSVDMVRLSGRFKYAEESRIDLPWGAVSEWKTVGKGRAAALKWIQTKGEAAKLDFDYFCYEGGKIGKFRDLWQFNFGVESVAALMACPRLGSGKPDWLAWTFEFNPNKVASVAIFRDLLMCLLANSTSCEIKRWDFAVDFPVIRQASVLVKDARLYQQVRDGSEDLTEYLGRRNALGYCKLYNKALERKISEPLTRLEVTLPDCTYSEMLRYWPPCYVYGSNSLEQAAAINAASSTLAPAQLFIVRSIIQVPTLQNELYVFNYRQKKKLDEILGKFRQAIVPSESVYSSVLLGLRGFVTGQF